MRLNDELVITLGGWWQRIGGLAVLHCSSTWTRVCIFVPCALWSWNRLWIHHNTNQDKVVIEGGWMNGLVISMMTFLQDYYYFFFFTHGNIYTLVPVVNLGSISSLCLLLLQEANSGLELAAEKRSAHWRGQTARTGVQVCVLNIKVF